MDESKQQQTERFPVYLTENEGKRFREFLEDTGRKASPFMRKMIMETVQNWEKNSQPNDQASALRDFMRKQG